MKLGGVRDGTVYVTRGLDIGTWSAEEGFLTVGSLPNPESGSDGLRFDAMNRWLPKRLLRPITGLYTTANVWPLGDDCLLATVSRWLFRSADGGRSWTLVRELPDSSGPMGVLPTAVREHRGRVYLAEYPLGDDPARVLVSDDRGRTWSPFVERPDVRHFHGLFVDPYTDRLWATTGDTNDESAIGVLSEEGFAPIGRGSQRWRAVGLAFGSEAVFWGKDSSYTERAEVLRLSRESLDDPDPTPETIATTACPIYYAETLDRPDEHWLVVSTTSTGRIDSTAPDGQKRNTCDGVARVLAASSASGYETWYELYATERRDAVGERVDAIPASNGYLFLATDPEHGLLINPYNTTDDNGDIVAITPAAFDEADFASYTDSRTEVRP
ncbi:WD40/YVTN/BNR-like repeat-containing protein [Halococcus sediminicola]|uniref:WD40/YVTN/BNR-like repeat-containing protein n=1 Tax=Halococcus sediminicola TaxID=1264579 RepID=UPI000678F30F|nr:glycosyl hydrolase [Halococcus sediminicola]